MITNAWSDYELIDAGSEKRIERFGTVTVDRPEPKALWNLSSSAQVDASYHRGISDTGRWQFAKELPKPWLINWDTLTFELKPTSFKHVGIFPEQSTVWHFIREAIQQANKPVKMLNLFGYTGAATLAALSAGASVTHVDASKDSLDWAHHNAKLSGLDANPVRWIPEDAVRFVKREVNRGNKYDAIIMDPPKFGRGSKNEVWKFEEDLPKLLTLCKEILTDTPLFVFLNAYSVDISSLTLHNLLQQTVQKQGNVTHGELCIEATKSKLLLPCSIFAAWTNSTIQIEK